MYKIILSTAFTVMLQTMAFSQVGIGTTTPDKSAILELSSTQKGFLLPRMTAEQKMAIIAPIKGLLVYQTDEAIGLYSYNGSTWVAVAAAGGIGNYVDLTTNQTIKGTKDFYDDILINGLTVGSGLNRNSSNTVFGIDALASPDAASNNTAIGSQTLTHTISGFRNTALGSAALYANTSGSDNSATGYRSLFTNISGDNNTAAGSSALYFNATGSNNAAFGNQAMQSNSAGNNNTATGDNAMALNLTGNNNVAIGAYSLYSNTNRSHLVAIGDYALFQNGVGVTSSMQATGNTAIGSQSLYGNTIGYSNSAIGSESLITNTEGFHNTATGFQSLYANTIGKYNTAHGSQALNANVDGNNNTANGFQALYTNSNGYSNTATGAGSLYFNNTGYNNTANGYQALLKNDGGYNNTAIGNQALLSNTNGFGNNAYGHLALYKNSTGTKNTAVGSNTLYANTTGSFNTAIGYYADMATENLNNASAIGAYARADCSNCMVLGSVTGINNGTANINVGIGVNAPLAKLHINPNGAGSVLIGTNKSVGGFTTLEMGISAQSAGNSFIQSTASAGSLYGDILLNPSGGHIGINHPDASTVVFPLDINQRSNVLGLRLRNALDNYTNNWDIFASSSSPLYFSYNGTNKSFISALDGSLNEVSDARLKTNIVKADDVLGKVMGLQPKSYQYLKNDKNSKKSTGFLAQEVLPFFPELISEFKYPTKDTTDDKTYYAINYAGFGVVAIKAIQEQQGIIDLQAKKIGELEEKINLILKKL